MIREPETLFAIETGEPAAEGPEYLYIGPADPRLGYLQIVVRGEERTLCDLPLQPHWNIRERTGRKVCHLCAAILATKMEKDGKR